MYYKQFDVRWSDLDANRHMANSAYQNFMSHTRMAYLIDNGFGQREMQQYQTGPVIFNENVYYFKEIHQGKPITVTCELTGLSDDGSLFSFKHNFYDHRGENLARGIMTGAWMNLVERKIMALHPDLKKKINDMVRSQDFTELSFKATRSHGQKPVAVNMDNLITR
ncbi:acyl-CoA thioesterase [Nonlabens ponticola]|uniref:Acyl-CoA thioesterase n=1 Tax=Nonlabens ponticola TaxID=2496866 RepID=A0A3S9MW88_9FLAO|nr:acyl-CoA thioesterase [Nonlabens ponticola]AZQ43383.1 acyl-CoA thioesterase [Nonlabens ponticola]